MLQGTMDQVAGMQEQGMTLSEMHWWVGPLPLYFMASITSSTQLQTLSIFLVRGSA